LSSSAVSHRSAPSTTLHHSDPSSSSSKLLSPSQSPAQPPLSSSLLHVLSDRRDLALQLFRATAAPRSDPRLHRIASLALAHADAPHASSVQHNV
jgi:hypothetical protein